MVIFQSTTLHSTGEAKCANTEIGGSSRGFRLEYEVFRYTVHLFC